MAAILKRADFVASNVPGVPMPVYVASSKITGMSTFGPTIGTSLNTTLLSYADTGTYPTKKAHVKAACPGQAAHRCRARDHRLRRAERHRPADPGRRGGVNYYLLHLGHNKLACRVALNAGIALATVFRFWSYRRFVWVRPAGRSPSAGITRIRS